MNAADVTKAEPFPWEQAMAFGFGVLRLPSHEFWRLTPLELASAMRALLGEPARVSRAVLDDLIARYPDR